MNGPERVLVPLSELPFVEWSDRDKAQIPLHSETEADVPVPEQPTPKQRAKSRTAVSNMKVSQKIGYLLFLNHSDELNIWGVRKLLHYQETQSWEALDSGVQFFLRLLDDNKLQRDFWICRFHLQRPFRPKTERPIPEPRRIGVGYRDKGTLPDRSQGARVSACQDAFINIGDLDERTKDYLQNRLAYLVVDREWLDLSGIPELDPGLLGEIRVLLRPR